MENKKKSLGFSVGFVSAIIALITGVALLIYGAVVGDAYAVSPALLVIGALIAGAGLLKDIHFLAIFPGICYMAAMGLYISSQLGNISGQLSETGFGATGTSLGMLIAFCVLMGVATILTLVSSFMQQYKEAK